MAAKSEEEEAQRQAFLAMMEVKEQVRNRLLPRYYELLHLSTMCCIVLQHC